MTMLTDEQQVKCFNHHVPIIENALVVRGVPQILSNALAVGLVLEYIEEAKAAPGLDIPMHKYGIKIRLESGDDVRLWLEFMPPNAEGFV